MTKVEKETIETFCRELTLALRRITGKTIDIQPDLFAAPGEDDQQPVWAQNPRESAMTCPSNECSN